MWRLTLVAPAFAANPSPPVLPECGAEHDAGFCDQAALAHGGCRADEAAGFRGSHWGRAACRAAP
ncbi:hypothetical protein [Herbidospora sp. RD11066]